MSETYIENGLNKKFDPERINTTDQLVLNNFFQKKKNGEFIIHYGKFIKYKPIADK